MSSLSATRSLLLCLGVTLVFSAACSHSDDASAPTEPPAISTAEAEAKLRRIVLTAGDIAPDYTQDSEELRDNAEAAALRPDADLARRQYEDWGQVLSLDIQFAAPATNELLFAGRTARVSNSASVFGSTEGAADAMTYLRGLPPETVAAYVERSSSGSPTKLSQTRVRRDAEPAATAADESFILRTTGTATLATGLEMNYVADTVFVRVGNTNGAITAIALNQPPNRDELQRLVGAFVFKARAASG